MASNLSKPIYEFGSFRVDLERYLLFRDGKSIPLSPKVFETLIFLIEHRGEVVKKDDLMNRVWPDTFVEESNLAQNIFLLRKSLGEEKNEHRYIITIPGVGYRFVAPVVESFKAIALKPNYPTAHHWYGELLTTAARFDEGLAQLRIAQELDPLSLAINADLAATFYYAKQYDRSENQLENLLELNPTFTRARVLLAKVWAQKGQHSKAIETLRGAVTLSGDDTVTLSALAYTLALAGQTTEANKILDDLQQSMNRRYVSAGNIATIYIGLDKKELAFQWLEKAFENKDIEMVWLKVSPLFDPLRSDARFTKLLERVSEVF